ncbi:MAG: GNAT family N-acetyltransferase [Candidatus Babeliales bacterium]
MKYNFKFKQLEEKDLPLLLKWFKEPHVDKWWPVPKEEEDFFNSFIKRIRDDIRKMYIVLCYNKPIGYIQCYKINFEKDAWLPKISGNVIGIDQFIGEPDFLHKGFGTLFIKEFIENLLEKENDLKIIVDPDPENKAAIRCYEKVGFEKIGEFQAPWGPALVMTYNK